MRMNEWNKGKKKGDRKRKGHTLIPNEIVVYKMVFLILLFHSNSIIHVIFGTIGKTIEILDMEDICIQFLYVLRCYHNAYSDMLNSNIPNVDRFSLVVIS